MLCRSNQRRERLAQLSASGETGAASYRAAYGVEGASAEVGASRLLRNDKVSERISELQRESATATTLNMQRRREILAEIAENKMARDADRINAVLADAKLAGELNGVCLDVNVTATAGFPVMTEERRAEFIEKKRQADERLRAMKGLPPVRDLAEEIGDPMAPLHVQLPTIITTPRPRRQGNLPAAPI